MAIHVTRCPHCQTSFRVRDEHLSTAKGMVRCGSCLQVFNAANYFVDESVAAIPPQPKAAAKTAIPTPTPVAAPKPTPKPAAKPAPQAVTKPVAKAAPAAQKPIPASAKVASKADDDIGLIHDDMEHDPIPELLADDPTVDFNLRAPEKKSRPKPRSELDFGEIILDLDDTGDLPFSRNDKHTSDINKDEAWAAALLEEDSKPTTPSEPTRPAPEKDDFQGFDDNDEFYELTSTPQDVMRSLNLGPLNNNKLDLGLAAIKNANLYNDPLTLQPKKQATPSWLNTKTVGWLLASVLMLGAAAAQVLYFNFDAWSRSPQWRDTYASLCATLGCELPHIQNVNSMATQHLRVQPHPRLKGALMVELLLVNNADYEQPFPDLLLSFRDINNRTLASRKFSPSQYLQGELAGQDIMPTHTPIHIALEVVDPGAEAVNYQLSLLPNQ